jgi:hypothetical protein
LFSSENKLEREFSIAYHNEDGPGIQEHDILVPDIAFSKVEEIIHCMQDLIRPLTSDAAIWYDQNLNRTKIRLKEGTSFQWSLKIMELIGFTKRGFFKAGEMTAPNPPKMGVGSYIYVYSDIVEPQFVGDTMTPLLRIVNNSSSAKQFASVSFSQTVLQVSWS